MTDLIDTLADIGKGQSVLRATALKVGYLKSMLHMRHYMLYGRDDTAAMSFGRLAHIAVLQPNNRPELWTGGKRSGKAWDIFEEQNAGKEIATMAEWRGACELAESVRANPAVNALLSDCMIEGRLDYADGDLGLCTARPDAFKPGILIDLKTTGRIDDQSLIRTVGGMAYHLQFGWYAWMIGQLFGVAVPDCYMIAVESKPPYDCRVVKLWKFDVTAGMAAAIETARRYRDCEKVGKWPGINREVTEIQLPEWAYKDRTAAGLEDGNMEDL